MLPIVKAPHTILSTPTKPVERIDEKIKKLVRQMEETLNAQTDPKGVGLAANQVESNLSLFIIKPEETSPIEVFINPKILEHTMLPPQKNRSQKKGGQELEGCLSIPKIWGSVERFDKIYVEYQTLSGEKKRAWFADFKALIIQHEIDHLKGILFTQKAMEQHAFLYEEKDGKLNEMKI